MPRRWPDEAAHRRLLRPVLARLAGRTATVRVLDFGGDKLPPFLQGSHARGLALLLGAPEALAAQLRAIAAEGSATDLRVLLPIAERAADVEAVRSLLPTGVAIGAMVESVAAVEAAAELAAAADFLSIGTNDLAHAAVGSDRFAGAATTRPRPARPGPRRPHRGGGERRGRPARGLRRFRVGPDRRAAARRARRRRAVGRRRPGRPRARMGPGHGPRHASGGWPARRSR